MLYANLLLNVLYHIEIEMKIRESCLQTGNFIYKPGISVTKQDFHLQTGILGLQMGFSGYYLPAQDGKETTTIRLINQTYFNVKNIKVTWNDGKEQTVNTLGSHDSIDFSSDAGSVYKMDVTGTTQSGEKFTGHFKGLVGKDTRVFIELDENADVQVFIPQGEID